MALSPMMKQYLITKEKYKDCIVMYRLGDFYEMFYDDAVTASNILGLVLTGRDCGESQRAPMCGVPYHAVNNYIAKLIDNGQKVAICEQLTSPDESKGLVERDVVRVVTSGTIIEDNILIDKQNNFLACVCYSNKSIGICWADLSTGECFVSQTEASNIKEFQNLILSINPKEIICNDIQLNTLSCIANGFIPKATLYNEFSYTASHSTQVLLKQFKVVSLDSYGLHNKTSAICATGGLIDYLLETQKRALSHISKIKYIECGNFMSLDINTRYNLEISQSRDNKRKGSLYNLLDNTCTNMGGRLLHNYLEQPLQDDIEINRRLNSVDELIDNFLLREALKQSLSSIKDIERLSAKISYDNLTPRDCLSLNNSLAVIPSIIKLLAKTKSEMLIKIKNEMFDTSDICQLLTKAIDIDAPATIKDGGYIRCGYNTDLDAKRNILSNSKQLIASLEAKERENTGIKSLKVGFNRVFGYYFEISNSNNIELPIRFIRKQTISTGERYFTEELKNLEDSILNSTEHSIRLEKQLFAQLRETLLGYVKDLQNLSHAIACLDVLVGFAFLAVNNNYTKPTITKNINNIEIIEGRHPIVELSTQKGCFVSNDTILDCKDNQIAIITGPNMSGKSTYMRQVALIVLLAHIGCFVPAKKACIPITDKIFTRVGAYDDLAFNQSTFMVEMSEVAYILNNATDKSLIVLDEVGRGTSTYDGLSIAWAVTTYIHNTIKAKTLFATHYHEITKLESELSGVKNYRVLVKENKDEIIFLHKIVKGSANKSFGIEVSILAGVPEQVSQLAKTVLEKLNTNSQSELSTKINTSDASSQILNTICNIDINLLTPIEAFDILLKLKNNLGAKNAKD